MTDPTQAARQALDEHLAASKRRERAATAFLGALLIIYLVAIWLTGWDTVAIIVGAVVALVAMFLTYRIRKFDAEADAKTTEQLMAELLLVEQYGREQEGK